MSYVCVSIRSAMYVSDNNNSECMFIGRFRIWTNGKKERQWSEWTNCGPSSRASKQASAIFIFWEDDDDDG